MQDGDGGSDGWWDVVVGNVSGGGRNVADFVSGTVGGVSGWWSARKREQEREAAEAAEGARHDSSQSAMCGCTSGLQDVQRIPAPP